jgi:hypothetical protein
MMGRNPVIVMGVRVVLVAVACAVLVAARMVQGVAADRQSRSST